MSRVLFTNLAGGTLLSPITSGATTLTLNSGQGALFPSPTGNQFFPLVLQSAANSALLEVTWCTSRSTDTLTIVRAQEGTSALAFNAGDLAQLRPTGATLELLGDWFPSDYGALSTSTSITLALYDGLYLTIGGSATTQTLPVASAAAGMVVGFLASSAFTLASSGGNFVGGVPAGTTTSLALKTADYVCVQSDGTNWKIFSANSTIGLVAPTLNVIGGRYNADSTIENWYSLDFGTNQGEGLYGPYSWAIPFPNAILNIQVSTLTPEGSGSGSSGDNYIQISVSNKPTTTQFWVWNNAVSGGTNAARGFYVRAIGW